MKQNKFFANVASKALALAATVMMSAAFTACSKDSDNDNGGGTPEPEPKGTLTVNGVDTPIRMAEYLKESDGEYYLYLYFANDRKGRVKFELNKDLHITGKPINLTKKEKKHNGTWYWAVQYYKPDDTKFIRTFGDPDAPEIPVFNTGTLTMSGLPTAIINIKLENGRVKGSDGNEHTLTLSYNGTMTNR